MVPFALDVPHCATGVHNQPGVIRDFLAEDGK